jgi:hypothetical protein
LTEVNEEIVRQSLEVEGFFVRTNVEYGKPKEKTGKKSSGYGDIDILAEHPDGRRFLVQVKGWHTESLAPNYFRNKRPFMDKLAKSKAKQVLGSNDFKTILVFSKVGKLRGRVKESARQQGIDYVKEFKGTLQQLIMYVEKHRNYDSEVLQTIRVLKVYGFLGGERQRETAVPLIWTEKALEIGP